MRPPSEGLWCGSMANVDPAGFAPGSFSDVDASGQAAAHAAYLDRAAEKFFERRRGWFAKLDLKAGDSVLDAGSGMGEVARALGDMVAPGGRVVGVDLS